MFARFLSVSAAALLATVAIPACSTSTPTGPSSGTASSVSFKTSVAPLLTSSCLSCHGVGGTGARDITIADASGNLDYATISQRAGAILREVRSGAMPQGGPKWSAEQISTFQTWYQAGAPDN